MPAPNILLEQTTDEYTLSDNKQDGESYSHVYYDTNKAQHTVSSTDVDNAFVVNNKGFDGGNSPMSLVKTKTLHNLKSPQKMINSTVLW